MLLQRQPDFDIVGEAADGLDGIKRAKALLPDVILLDLHMPGLSGLETLQLLVQDLPNCAVLILTVSEEAEELGQALRDGACGYLLKNIDAESLTTAIRKVATGEPVIDSSMTAKLIAQFRSQASADSTVDAERAQLTTREREIVQCLARGESNKVIARNLSVAESTVKIHVQNILKKLNLSSRVQVAVYAVEHGLHSDDCWSDS